MIETEFDDVRYLVHQNRLIWYHISIGYINGKRVFYLTTSDGFRNESYYDIEFMRHANELPGFRLIRDEKEFLVWKLKNADRI